MSDFSRRAFMASMGVATGSLGLSARAAILGIGGEADVLLLGGTFHTMDSRTEGANAIALRGNRILAIGQADDLRALAGPNTRVIDTSGATITPGFIDAHSHPLLANEAISVNVDFRRIPQVVAALRERAAATPPGQWVLGHMYDDTKFEEGRPVTRQDLDNASTEHPIFIQHRGGHTAVANSAAFALAGVTADTPDPEGGAFYRDENGLTGRLAEKALDVLRSSGDWPQADRADNQESARLITARMCRTGLTSTTDAFGSPESWQAYVDAYAADELSCRVSFMPGNGPCYESFKAAGLRSGFGNAWLNVGAVKYGADGSASERTMRMSTPFAGRPHDFGILTMDQQQIDAAVDDAVANNFRIGIHANGDVTIDMVLTAYERVLAGWQGVNPRFRIEHCSLVNPDLLARISDTGTVPTPFYTYAHYHGEKWHEYGKDKMEWMFAHRSFLDYGIPVAPASDYTPGPYEPMMALQSMVTRQDPEGNVWGASQRISVKEALRICTVHGAYASFEEDTKGSLSPGKLADLVVLGSDPEKVDVNRLKDIPVQMTMVDGRIVHEA